MRLNHYRIDADGVQSALIEPNIPAEPSGSRLRRLACGTSLIRSSTSSVSDASGAASTQGRGEGTLDRIHEYSAARSAPRSSPYHSRTSASVDSRSINATSGDEQRGRDNAKDVDSRKRHFVVDSMSLLLAMLVTIGPKSERPAKYNGFDRCATAGKPFQRLDQNRK